MLPWILELSPLRGREGSPALVSIHYEMTAGSSRVILDILLKNCYFNGAVFLPDVIPEGNSSIFIFRK